MPPQKYDVIGIRMSKSYVTKGKFVDCIDHLVL
jgi:hypothetical protein